MITPENQAASVLALPPGTVRRATSEERKIAGGIWNKVETLPELESHLKKTPEEGVLLDCGLTWKSILRSVARSGAASTCRVLVAAT